MIRPRAGPVASRTRLRLLAAVLAVGFLVVGGQLANLQILSGERLAELSDRNRIRLRPIAAPRGIMFDRSGLPLVDNRPAFSLVVVPRDVPDMGALVTSVSSSSILTRRCASVREMSRTIPARSWPSSSRRPVRYEPPARSPLRSPTTVSPPVSSDVSPAVSASARSASTVTRSSPANLPPRRAIRLSSQLAPAARI